MEWYRLSICGIRHARQFARQTPRNAVSNDTLLSDHSGAVTWFTKIAAHYYCCIAGSVDAANSKERMHILQNVLQVFTSIVPRHMLHANGALSF